MSAPVFTQTPRLASVQVTAANTNRDGTGTVVDVITGATNGTRIDRITIEATVTTTAGMVRLYIYDGTNTRLWQESPVYAITPSGTVVTHRAVLDSLRLILPNGYKIRASTHNGETFNVIAEGGDF